MRSLRLALAALAALLGPPLPACLAPAPVDDESAAVTAALDTPTYAQRSLVITSPTAQAQVTPAFTLTRLLTDVGAYLQTIPGAPNKTGAAWNVNPFVVGAADVTNHNAWTGLQVGTVHASVNSFAAILRHFVAQDPPTALCADGIGPCQASNQLTLPSPPPGT